MEYFVIPMNHLKARKARGEPLLFSSDFLDIGNPVIMEVHSAAIFL